MVQSETLGFSVSEKTVNMCSTWLDTLYLYRLFLKKLLYEYSKILIKTNRFFGFSCLKLYQMNRILQALPKCLSFWAGTSELCIKSCKRIKASIAKKSTEHKCPKAIWEFLGVLGWLIDGFSIFMGIKVIPRNDCVLNDSKCFVKWC